MESLLRPPRGLRRPTRSAWLCSQLRGAAVSTSNVGSKGEYAADTSAAPPLPALLLVSLPPSWLSKSSDSACASSNSLGLRLLALAACCPAAASFSHPPSSTGLLHSVRTSGLRLLAGPPPSVDRFSERVLA